jgi:hypothetical protein
MDMGAMGVSGRPPKLNGEVWDLQKLVKAPKFGKAVKFEGFCPFFEWPAAPLHPFLGLPANTHHIHIQTSVPKISVSTYFYTYFFTGIQMDRAARSKGLTIQYKAYSGPNPCHNLRPNDNTHHQSTCFESFICCLLHGGTKGLTTRYKGRIYPNCSHNYYCQYC